MNNIIDSMLKFLADKSYVTGEANGWRYKKYNDGRIEYWTTVATNTRTDYWTGWGGQYYAKLSTGVQPYPFKMKVVEDEQVSTIIEDAVAYQALAPQIDPTASPPEVVLYTFKPDSYNRKVTIRMHIWGRLK